MAEAEWLKCTEPEKMLAFVGAKASDRKLRLFACACCRRIWHLLADERSRRVIEVAERYADGLVSEDECIVCREAAYDAHCDHGPTNNAWTAAAYNTACPPHNFADFAWDCASNAQQARSSKAEPRSQASLLRDVLSNPFRPVPVAAKWRTANLVNLAQAVYEEREFPSGQLDNMRLGVLADALEEAGCDNADILSHCRQPGPHVRGCWAVDLALGKE